MKTITTADKIIKFNEFLAKTSIALPSNYKIVNPFNGDNCDLIKRISDAFYHKYYNDTKTRRIILGSSPARRGTAVTGVPFEDAAHLQVVTGIAIEGFKINKASSNFLFEVIKEYGGFKEFYSNFYMNFLCPLGIVQLNSLGRYINCNYYENKQLKNYLRSFIIDTLKMQLKFNLDLSICYCIGSGENYKFLLQLNEEYGFFGNIVALEHPRYIMQYNSNKKNDYIDKYISAFRF